MAEDGQNVKMITEHDHLDHLQLQRGNNGLFEDDQTVKIISEDDHPGKSDNLQLNNVNTSTYRHILLEDDQDDQTVGEADNLDNLHGA